MAIITRPNKPSSGGGTDYVDGADIEANEVNDDLNTVYSDYNGNVTAANISPIAAIPGTCLADSPSGIPTTKINDDAVTDAKLADHATLDANRAVGANHIKTQSIATNKLKSTLGLVHVVSVVSSSIGGGIGVRITANPTLSYPKATYDLVGMYIKNLSTATTITAIGRADDTGANWGGAVDFFNWPGGAPGTASCSLVYVFVEKS